MSLLTVTHFIANHPLSHGRRIANLARFAAWQVRSRLTKAPMTFEFVGTSRLFVTPGMTSATGHLYVGLMEFEDMAFVAHALRPGDVFADVGANIGSYAVLASGAVGARSIAFEPIPSARAWLNRNIALNKLETLIEVRAEAVGAREGSLRFTTGLDVTNHAVPEGEVEAASIAVPVTTLDIACKDRWPAVVKVDVEGFETAVVDGATEVLSHPDLLALVMEFNGAGARYGFDEEKLHQKLAAFGLRPYSYRPFERLLTAVEKVALSTSDNIILVRDRDRVQKRLSEAPPLMVRGKTV